MKPQPQRNLWELMPRRMFEHRISDEGLASIQVPRFRARWMGWLQRRLRKPHVQLLLDELGTAVWLACDGERNMAQIANELEARFGTEQEVLAERLGLVIQHLDRGGLISCESSQGIEQ